MASISDAPVTDGHATPQGHLQGPIQKALDFWLQSIHNWFPDLHKQTYFVPPLHFNRVLYGVANVAGQSVLVPKTAPNEHVPGTRANPVSKNVSLSSQRQQPPLPSRVWPDDPTVACPLPRVFDNDARDDRAEHQVLQHLREVAEKGREVMVVISRLDFRKYLDKKVNAITAAATALLPKPDKMGAKYQRGDFDVLIIHRHHGIIVGEVKAVGANAHRTQDLNRAIASRVQKALKQIEKAGDVLRHLVSDLGSVNVTKTLMLPGITSEQLLQALETDHLVKQHLLDCFETTDISVAVQHCLCSDDLSSMQWWQSTLADKGPDASMTSQLYEALVARFCGPATTIEVPTVTTPRCCLEMRTLSEAIAHTGLRMAMLTLFPEQVDLVNRPDLRLVFLKGPPGTGKTVVLVIKGLQWGQQGKHVHLLSSHTGSRASILLIEHQLLLILGDASAEAASPDPRVHVHMYDFRNKSGDVEAAVNTLSAAARDGQLYVIVDEAYHGSKFGDFCTQLAARVPDLHLWAAAVRYDVIPPCLSEERLTVPLRCPPSVVKEVEKSDWINTGSVFPYTTSAAPAPTDGPGLRWLSHYEQPGHSGIRPEECETCGESIADLLVELRVGQGDLQYRDVLIMCLDPREDLGVVRGLRSRGVPVRVVTSRSPVSAIRDVAIASQDEVTATDDHVVSGLERRVVVGVGTVCGMYDALGNDPYYRLYAMSRCSAQLVWVDNPTHPGPADLDYQIPSEDDTDSEDD